MESLIEAIEKHSDDLSTLIVDANLLSGILCIITIFFVLRYVILWDIEISTNKSSTTKTYLIGHVILEHIIACLLCFFFLAITKANSSNVFLSFFFFPILSSVVAILIDNKVFIPLDKKPPQRIDDDDVKKEKSSKLSIDATHEDEEYEPDSEIVKKINSFQEFRKEIVNTVSEIKEIQCEHGKSIKENVEKLDSIIGDIQKLKVSEMQDKKLELKRMIYKCLTKGYATPEENDKISIYYESYKSLGGNGEVETLYRQRYLYLPVHPKQMENHDDKS